MLSSISNEHKDTDFKAKMHCAAMHQAIIHVTAESFMNQKWFHLSAIAKGEQTYPSIRIRDDADSVLMHSKAVLRAWSATVNWSVWHGLMIWHGHAHDQPDNFQQTNLLWEATARIKVSMSHRQWADDDTHQLIWTHNVKLHHYSPAGPAGLRDNCCLLSKRISNNALSDLSLQIASTWYEMRPSAAVAPHKDLVLMQPWFLEGLKRRSPTEQMCWTVPASTPQIPLWAMTCPTESPSMLERMPQLSRTSPFEVWGAMRPDKISEFLNPLQPQHAVLKLDCKQANQSSELRVCFVKHYISAGMSLRCDSTWLAVEGLVMKEPSLHSSSTLYSTKVASKAISALMRNGYTYFPTAVSKLLRRVSPLLFKETVAYSTSWHHHLCMHGARNRTFSTSHSLHSTSKVKASIFENGISKCLTVHVPKYHPIFYIIGALRNDLLAPCLVCLRVMSTQSTANICCWGPDAGHAE